ncbi:hypothetical protein JCM8547_008187 [Rhodosporidiobolus lusitaniae]
MATTGAGSNPHPRPVALAVSSLRLPSPLALSPLHLLTGRIVASTPYSPSSQTASFTLASLHPSDHSLRFSILFRGSFAQTASSSLLKTFKNGSGGLTLVLSGKGARAEVRPLSKREREEGREVSEMERVRAVWASEGEGVRGEWRSEEGEKGRTVERFAFKGDSTTMTTKSKGKKAVDQRQKPVVLGEKTNLSRSSSSSTSSSLLCKKLEKVNASCDNPETPSVEVVSANSGADVVSGQPRRDEEKRAEKERQKLDSGCELELDSEEAEMPSTEEKKRRKREAAEESEEEEISEEEDKVETPIKPVRKQRKRERKEKEERTTWGLNTDKFTYLALDSLPSKNTPGNNVIAVVHRPYAPELQFHGTGDYKSRIWLFDPTCADPPGVRLDHFASRHDEKQCCVPEDGDIVVFQQLHWKNDRGHQSFMAYKERGFFTILPSSLLLNPSFSPSSPSLPPHPCPTRAAKLTDSELLYARDLARWSKKHGLVAHVTGKSAEEVREAEEERKRGVVQEKKKAGGGRKKLRVEEVQPDEFCDLLGEIVKYHNPFSSFQNRPPTTNEPCELYLTDYTSHPLIEDYSNSSSFPTGKRVLKIALFGNQNDPLLDFPPDKLRGRLVTLRNVRPKIGGFETLEATMMEDQKYERKRDVVVVPRSREGEAMLPAGWLSAFKARRDAYWNGTEEYRCAPYSASVTAEASSSVAQDGPLVFTTPSDRKPTPAAVDPLSQISDISNLSPVTLGHAVSLSSPGTYRMRVRVVDYYPKRLEDWVVAFCPECDRDLSEMETDACIEHGKVDYEWSFKLAFVPDEQDGEDWDKKIVVSASGSEGYSLFPLFPSTSFSSIRSGTSLHPVLSRLRGILGSLDAQKRRKSTTLEPGPAWDVVLEAVRTDAEGEGGEVKWRIKTERVKFGCKCADGRGGECEGCRRAEREEKEREKARRGE